MSPTGYRGRLQHAEPGDVRRDRQVQVGRVEWEEGDEQGRSRGEVHQKGGGTQGEVPVTTADVGGAEPTKLHEPTMLYTNYYNIYIW